MDTFKGIWPQECIVHQLMALSCSSRRDKDVFCKAVFQDSVLALLRTWADATCSSACRDPVRNEKLSQHLRRQARLHSALRLRNRRAILHGAGCRGVCYAILHGSYNQGRGAGCVLRSEGGLKWGCQSPLLLSYCERGPQSFLTGLAIGLQALGSLASVALRTLHLQSHTQALMRAVKQPSCCGQGCPALTSYSRTVSAYQSSGWPGSLQSHHCLNIIHY